MNNKSRKICYKRGKNGMLEKFFCDDDKRRSPIIRSRRRPRPSPPSPHLFLQEDPTTFLSKYLKPPQRRMRLALDYNGKYHEVPEELPNDKRYFEDLEKRTSRYTDQMQTLILIL